jgi:hypothetical protein
MSQAWQGILVMVGVQILGIVIVYLGVPAVVKYKLAREYGNLEATVRMLGESNDWLMQRLFEQTGDIGYLKAKINGRPREAVK